MAAKAMGSGLFYFFENGLKMDLLAVEYRLDKDRMADLGMTLGPYNPDGPVCFGRLRHTV